MSKKPTYSNVTNRDSVATEINSALSDIVDGFDNTLSLDGSTPNAMNADLDLNNNDLLNVKNVNADEITIDGVDLTVQVANAAASATAAATSETNAAASETQAAISAASAATAVGRALFETVSDLTTDNNNVIGYTGSGAEFIVSAGDIVEAGGFRYETAASGASDNHVVTAGGVKLYVKPGADGRANILAFGADSTGASDNSTIIAAAIASGLPLTASGGTYNMASRVSLTEGSDILGPKDAIFKITSEDTAHFLSDGLSYFAIRGVTLEGITTSSGTTDPDQRGSIVVHNTDDFDVEFVTFNTCFGSGVSISRQGTYVNGGRVRFCHFIKGTMTGGADAWGLQDCAPVQIYQYAKNITVQGNVSEGRFYCALLVQDQINDGASRIYDIRAIDNEFRDLSQYGIVCYTLATLTLDSFADNGSGVFRVTTTAAHNLTDGDMIHLQECGDASGIWEVDVQTTTTFDLVGSTYSASTSIGGIRMSENCAGQFHNNLIDGVDGDREFSAGNQPYGAGFYIQSAGGIFASDNIFRRTNLNSNSETLTPGSIGINKTTGTCHFAGGQIYESGYHGLSVKTSDSYGRVFIGGGMIIERCAEAAARLSTPRFCTFKDIEIVPKPEGGGSRFFCNNETDRGRDVVLEGVVCHRFDDTTQANFMELRELDRFTMRNCRVVNKKPSSESFEPVRVVDCDAGRIHDNWIDGGDSAYNAMVLDGTTDTLVENNRIRMQDDGAARAAVRMTNTCTGTIFARSNDVLATDGTPPRMDNSSTGGQMHTRDTSVNTGGKTRQIGDTIENTDYADTEALFWVKTAVSTGASDWKALTPV